MDGNPRTRAEPDCAERVKNLGKQVITVSSLTLLFGFVGYIQSHHPMGEFGHSRHDSSVFLLLLAPWGLTTGIGFLWRWRWTRISMLVFSGILSAFGVLGIGAFLFMRGGGDLRWEVLVRGLYVLLFLIPSMVGVRWLLYFTRDDVKSYFQSSRESLTASA